MKAERGRYIGRMLTFGHALVSHHAHFFQRLAGYFAAISFHTIPMARLFPYFLTLSNSRPPSGLKALGSIGSINHRFIGRGRNAATVRYDPRGAPAVGAQVFSVLATSGGEVNIIKEAHAPS